MLTVVAEIVEEQGLQPSWCWSVRWMLWFGTVLWISQTASQQRRTLSSTPRSSSVFCTFGVRERLYANVVFFMILVDVPMQTRLGVMDEVPRLIEPVEIDVAKAPPAYLLLLCQAWGIHRRYQQSSAASVMCPAFPLMSM